VLTSAKRQRADDAPIVDVIDEAVTAQCRQDSPKHDTMQHCWAYR
jgi:hypothetical protein